MEKTNVLLSIRNVSKSFPGVKALDNVSLDVNVGSVIALLGENGAGKSTLMKILSGAYVRDQGEIILDGISLPKQYTPMAAHKFGISIIYQELSLMNELTVMENIYICNEPLKFNGIIDFKAMQVQAEQQLKKLDADYISVNSKVADLPLPQKQLVEIAKALALKCKVLIMDEPTTSLTDEEASKLFGVIQLLKKHGISVIYISHRMNEIFQICDTAIVMRDGKISGSLKITTGAEDQLIDLMTGRILSSNSFRKRKFEYGQHPVALEVQNISDGRFIKNQSLKLFEGEVLGIGGLIGSKRTELFKMVCGIDKMTSGVIKVHGKTVKIDSPVHAIQCGIGYLCENRKEDGLCQGMSVEENTIQCDYAKTGKYGIISWKKVREVAAKYFSLLKIKGLPTMQVMNLSGGNQQKVSIAKWLHAGCTVLIFDEPTRGIDIGAKAEIHKLIRDFAIQKGNAAVVISSEAHELLAVSDRVIVMSKGCITSELKGDEIEVNNLNKKITHSKGIIA